MYNYFKNKFIHYTLPYENVSQMEMSQEFPQYVH